MCTNQLYLVTDPRFIIYDLGVHALGSGAFFIADAVPIYCQSQRVNARTKAEDVATLACGAYESAETGLPYRMGESNGD